MCKAASRKLDGSQDEIMAMVNSPSRQLATSPLLNADDVYNFVNHLIKHNPGFEFIL